MSTLLAPESPPRRAVPEAVEVSDTERAALVANARAALAAALGASADLHDLPPQAEAVRDRRGGAFVTLTKDGELRGCVGLLDPSRRLVESVALAAVGAALRDPRFEPVRRDELAMLELQVSVLGPCVELDEPTAFRPGVDGLLVERGAARGLLLPEVATTHDMGVVGMLDAVCRKAGLPDGAWREPGTRVSAFRTARFGGPAADPEPTRVLARVP